MKKLLLGILAVGLAGGGYALWVYNKPHEDVRDMKAQAVYRTDALIKAFSKDAAAMDSELSDKIVEIKGMISAIDHGETQVLVQFDEGGDYIITAYLPVAGNEVSLLREGREVVLKSRYSGYVINDDSFLIPADIKFEPCYLQE